jgi:hypothetical protein
MQPLCLHHKTHASAHSAPAEQSRIISKSSSLLHNPPKTTKTTTTTTTRERERQSKKLKFCSNSNSSMQQQINQDYNTRNIPRRFVQSPTWKHAQLSAETPDFLARSRVRDCCASVSSSPAVLRRASERASDRRATDRSVVVHDTTSQVTRRMNGGPRRRNSGQWITSRAFISFT